MNWKYFFKRLWSRPLFGRRQQGFDLDGDDYAPTRYSLSRHSGWPGPIYIRRKRWRRDLSYIMEQLCCLVRVNAPLVAGVEALAREERRQSGMMQPQPWWRVVFMTIALLYTVQAAYHMSLIAVEPLYLGAWGIAGFCLIPFVLLVLAYLWAKYREAASPVLFILMPASVVIITIVVLESTTRQGVLATYEHMGVVFLALFYLSLLLPAVLLVVVLAIRLPRGNRIREAVLVAMRNHLAAGCEMSEMMRRLPRFFPGHFADMTAVGEVSGRLEDCLETLNEAGQTQDYIYREIKPTLLYLCIVGIVQLLIILFLSVRVFPVFHEIWAEFGGEYTPRASMLARAGYAVVSFLERQLERPLYISPASPQIYVPLIVLVAVAAWLGFKAAPGISAFFRRRLASLLLYLPGVGGMIRRNNLSTIALLLEQLLKAGVPLEQALEQAASCDMNRGHTRMVGAIRARILQGDSLAEACAAITRYPVSLKSFSGMIAIGEHAGMLPEALRFLADTYTTQLRFRTRVAVSLVQPACTLLLGLFTLMVVYYACTLVFGLTELFLQDII